jgi:hypothetical protein
MGSSAGCVANSQQSIYWDRIAQWQQEATAHGSKGQSTNEQDAQVVISTTILLILLGMLLHCMPPSCCLMHAFLPAMLHVDVHQQH